jgi:hypothetical protein
MLFYNHIECIILLIRIRIVNIKILYYLIIIIINLVLMHFKNYIYNFML